jgi:hypothetical protein
VSDGEKPTPTNLHVIARQPDEEMKAAFAGMARTWAIMAQHADEMARARKTMFDAYVKAGFTPAQALELAKSLMI